MHAQDIYARELIYSCETVHSRVIRRVERKRGERAAKEQRDTRAVRTRAITQ